MFLIYLIGILQQVEILPKFLIPFSSATQVSNLLSSLIKTSMSNNLASGLNVFFVQNHTSQHSNWSFGRRKLIRYEEILLSSEFREEFEVILR